MRFAVFTLGCKVNQYDSAIIEDRLAERGFERCKIGQKADVYIVNTCTVTNRADAESLRLARRVRRLNPEARLVMTGCLAQANPPLFESAAEVDVVVGLGRLDDVIRAAAGEVEERLLVSDLRKRKAPIELEAVAPPGHTRSFLKVQEGCDQFCAFCIVPRSRGMSRSVEPRRAVEALEELAARGFKEVTLSGVHLGGYGKDLSPPVTLEELLEMIAERAPIGRVRLSSLDPEELSDRIIDIVAGGGIFCPHFHLPLQAGDDAILARMRRRYDTAHYRARVERVLEAMPEAAIGTDLIVGFPGEGPEHFERSIGFVESLPLTYLHVFPYSAREGTRAAKLEGRVAPAEKSRRSQLMRQLGEQKRRAFVKRFIGSKLKVLLEEHGERDELSGYSRNYLRVSTRGRPGLLNHEVDVEARLAQGSALFGEIVWPQGACGQTASPSSGGCPA